MSITLKVLSIKKVMASHKINQAEQLIIEARAKSNYQLIDDKTGFAPDNIITQRDGKNLKIHFNDGDMSEDIIIKNYYTDETGETTNLLVGQHENGRIYAYVPESGLQSEAVSLLADQTIVPQTLGGTELTSVFWAFNPWWLLGLSALAGGIALAASGGGSGGSSASNDNNSSKTNNKAEINKAKEAVAAAEKAAEAYKKAFEAAQKDGVISKEEANKLQGLKEAVEAAKAKANDAIQALPDNQEKADLQTGV
ncbi:GA-like domain-containing protein, partial [Rodentibacter heidelbergensis]|uniref:GA-like domain-containing protein n=1 Tax=Rodentibacter heidelbergensis TaxID=1908258 RepID=UPI003CC5DB6A